MPDQSAALRELNKSFGTHFSNKILCGDSEVDQINMNQVKEGDRAAGQGEET